MKLLARLTLILGASIYLSSCVGAPRVLATQGLRVISNPEGATVISPSGGECVTPCTIFLSTDKGGEVTVSKAGYKPQTVKIGTKFDKVGAALEAPDIVDPASVAISAVFFAAFGKGMYKKLDRNRLDVVLELAGGPELNDEDDLNK